MPPCKEWELNAFTEAPLQAPHMHTLSFIATYPTHLRLMVLGVVNSHDLGVDNL